MTEFESDQKNPSHPICMTRHLEKYNDRKYGIEFIDKIPRAMVIKTDTKTKFFHIKINWYLTNMELHP